MTPAHTAENKKGGVRIRLYSRLMICYTAIFLLVTYVFASFFLKYYVEYERVKRLEQSRDALNAVCGYYAIKQTALPDTILPFYQTNGGSFSLDSVLRSPSDEAFSDPSDKMQIFDVLQKIAERDGDIKEILLYKQITGSGYAYQRKNRTVEAAGAGYPFFDVLANQESNRITTGSRKTGGAGSDVAYGIGGVIGMNEDSGIAGAFLITFNTQALERILEGYSGTLGRFVMVTPGGDVVFDSDGNYDGEIFPYIDVLLSGEDSAWIEGKKYYIQIVEERGTDVIGANIVPEEAFGDKKVLLAVYGAFTLMAIICAALYMLGGHLISRRIKALELAMKRVGLNNLSYRIPISKPSDEFEEIAVKFNEMCDELQRTIESEYISEIKKKNAELGSLQAGINPHFLFNTLEAIRVMAVDAGNDVSSMIVNLANLYRAIVRDRTFIPIRNEVNICEMYIDIFTFRYKNALEYEMNIDDRIMGFGIPKNLLQPIIENYFVHGIRGASFENRFEIKGFIKDGDIRFALEDNGWGLSKEQLDETKKNIEMVQPDTATGYGLVNIQKRIRLIYGEPYGITLESEEDSLTRVTVTIKAMTCEELEASLKSLGNE